MTIPGTSEDTQPPQIIRATKEERQRTGFTIISNERLRNPHLDPFAIGLLDILLSKPDDWHFTATGLRKQYGSKRVITALRQLEDEGYYFVPSSTRTKDNQIRQPPSVVYEIPLPPSQRSSWRSRQSFVDNRRNNGVRGKGQVATPWVQPLVKLYRDPK